MCGGAGVQSFNGSAEGLPVACAESIKGYMHILLGLD